MKKYILVFFLAIPLLGACQEKKQPSEPIGQVEISGKKPLVTLPMGNWKGELALQEGIILPFRFKVSQIKGGYPILQLLNAEEQILVNEIKPKGDSIAITLHIFNTQLIVKLDGKTMTGRWVKNDYNDYSVPFKATLLDDTMKKKSTSDAKIEGKWAVNFKNEGEADEKAVGVFRQEGERVTGTFLTATGDYRYLDGSIKNGKLELGCFDGEHAFLFRADLAGDKLENGTFWSGKHWKQPWEAKRDEKATLPDANKLTFLKEGYNQLAFSFPNIAGGTTSLTDEKYKGKVVIVQLLGSWCPNCMDESKFLAPFYQDNKDKGFEVIGLAFERDPAFEAAKARLDKMKNKIGIDYDLLVAGSNSNDEAAEKLPMLNHVLAFPTTIFIDKKGKVRKIHTGFSGPGTGEYYEQFVEEFNLFVEKLLAE